MKGEITGSKRHFKGHKSKLSFSRFDDPRVTSRLFPHSIVLPLLTLGGQTIRLLIALLPAQLGRKFGGKSGKLGTDFFGHQSTLPKKAPNDFLGFVTKSTRGGRSLVGGKNFPT